MRQVFYIILAVSAFTSDRGNRPQNVTENDSNLSCASSNFIQEALVSNIAHLLTEIDRKNISSNRNFSSKGSTFINNLNVGIQTKKEDTTKNSTFSTSNINRENNHEKIYLNDFLLYFVIVGSFFGIVLFSLVLYFLLTKFNSKNKPEKQTYYSASDKFVESSDLTGQIVQE